MFKRLFDITGALIGLLLVSPLFLIISLWIMLDSRGGVFYRQTRVGRNNRDFTMFKFRSMFTASDRKGLLTVGMKDNRITRAGYFLRKYKLDELPQLINVLNGSMSFVGPRPEVRKYVDLYSPEQMKVLDVPPGITDLASLEYFDENRILGDSANPEHDYIHLIMPEKLRLNLLYIHNRSLFKDLMIIFKTIKKILV